MERITMSPAEVVSYLGDVVATLDGPEESILALVVCHDCNNHKFISLPAYNATENASDGLSWSFNSILDLALYVAAAESFSIHAESKIELYEELHKSGAFDELGPEFMQWASVNLLDEAPEQDETQVMHGEEMIEVIPGKVSIKVNYDHAQNIAYILLAGSTDQIEQVHQAIAQVAETRSGV